MMEEPPSKATVAMMNVQPIANMLKSAESEVLIQNLRSMVNEPEYSDVQFVCSDGGRVRACRLLLVARSPVLKSLLTNGMSESRLTEIPLPDITTAAMLTTVEFLYTGTISQNNLTLAAAFQTVHASRFLLLHNLEECVMQILVAALKEEVMDAELLVWCFTQFAQLDTEENPILNEEASGAAGLVKDMASKLEDMDTHSLNKLCVPAFDLYLATTISSNQATISLKMYLRLRRILLWACTKVSVHAEKLLRLRLPDEENVRGAFETFRESLAERKFVKKEAESPLEPSMVRELGTWVEKLHSGWSSVELQFIHPLILAEIVEPLDIVPQPIFFSALRCQAVVLTGKINVLRWRPSVGCEIEENGVVLQCVSNETDKLAVFARADMVMSHGLYEWEITVEAPCTVLAIGLQEGAGITDMAYLNQTGTGVHTCGGTTRTSLCKAFGHKGSKVRLHLDMRHRTCAFTIDGEKLDLQWSDLPHKVFPIVWLNSPGRVRIQLLSNSDII